MESQARVKSCHSLLTTQSNEDFASSGWPLKLLDVAIKAPIKPGVFSLDTVALRELLEMLIKGYKHLASSPQTDFKVKSKC